MTRFARTFLAGACAVAIAGCATIPQSAGTLAGISLHVQPESATAGQAVTLRLVNEHSPEHLGYNLCASHLERRVGDDWQAIPSHRVCTMELRILEPDRSATYRFDLPQDLPPGEYRAVTVVLVMETDDRIEVTSDRFRVR